MAGQPIATIGSMHVCPMVNGTVPHVGGPVLGPGVPGILINGQPIAVVGDMCACAGPPDSIVMGCSGVLANGKPVAVMGSATSHGGVITMGIPGVTVGPSTPTTPSNASVQSKSINIAEVKTTETSSFNPSEGKVERAPAVADYLGVAEQPLVEEQGNGVEESEVNLESTILLDALTAYANEKDVDFFVSSMTTLYGHEILPATYANLYDKLKNGEINPAPIEVVKNNVVGDVNYDPPKPIHSVNYIPPKRKALGLIPLPKPTAPAGANKIFVSEAIVKKSKEDEDVHKALMSKLEAAFTDYIHYLLLHELTANKKEKDEPAEIIDRHIG